MSSDKDQLSESAIARKLMPFTGNFAYPTVYLFVASLLIYLASSILGAMHIVPLWLASAINTICAYLLFTPLHEAVHQNIKGRKKNLVWLENFIGWIAGLSLMIPFPVFHHLHIVHHGHTNDPKNDPDYWVAGKNPMAIFIRCMTIYFVYYYHFIKATKKLRSTSKGKNVIISTVFVFTILNGVIIWLGVGYGWTYPIFIYVVPAYLALGFLAFAFDWLPHHPHSVQQRYLDTRIILKPGLSTILVSQNMHLIHHLYSGIPYYHYGDALEVLEEKLEKEGANIER